MKRVGPNHPTVCWTGAGIGTRMSVISGYRKLPSHLTLLIMLLAFWQNVERREVSPESMLS